MTIRNEALISRYFDRLMTPAEEQNFLISLAASDELRLAFRSHLELMKAIRDDKHDMRPIAEVRGRTLAVLGLSALATAPFLEQALIRQAPSTVSEASFAPPKTLFSRLSGKFLLTGSGLVTGFLAASLIFSPSPNSSEVHSSTGGGASSGKSAEPSAQSPAPSGRFSNEPSTDRSNSNPSLATEGSRTGSKAHSPAKLPTLEATQSGQGRQNKTIRTTTDAPVQIKTSITNPDTNGAPK